MCVCFWKNPRRYCSVCYLHWMVLAICFVALAVVCRMRFVPLRKNVWERGFVRAVAKRDDHFARHFSTIIEMHFCLLARNNNNILTSCLLQRWARQFNTQLNVYNTCSDGCERFLCYHSCSSKSVHSPAARNHLVRIAALCQLMFMFAECMIKTRVIKWIFIATR